jgi:ABC-type lipoprotein export system ATPase subunit
MKNTTDRIYRTDIRTLERDFPQIIRFLGDYGIHFAERKDLTLEKSLNELPEDFFQDIGIDLKQMHEHLEYFLNGQTAAAAAVQSVTIIGGHDKQGNAENVRLELLAGSVTGIVGPTGSGKSRLLADIEWMAQNDTPTGRTILINQQLPDVKNRFSPEHKLVAQLSQNMNFVMDASVGEFIRMHAACRLRTADSDRLAADIVAQANLLAGEDFPEHTPLTALSGGQSRALMIADTAFLSASPIVLIDEIENAGIDRKKALHLLVSRNKIVLMATHDPILALMADQRLVIKNGGIQQVIRTSAAEKKALVELEKIDNQMQELKQQLRTGKTLGA